MLDFCFVVATSKTPLELPSPVARRRPPSVAERRHFTSVRTELRSAVLPLPNVAAGVPRPLRPAPGSFPPKSIPGFASVKDTEKYFYRLLGFPGTEQKAATTRRARRMGCSAPSRRRHARAKPDEAILHARPRTVRIAALQHASGVPALKKNLQNPKTLKLAEKARRRPGQPPREMAETPRRRYPRRLSRVNIEGHNTHPMLLSYTMCVPHSGLKRDAGGVEAR